MIQKKNQQTSLFKELLDTYSQEDLMVHYLDVPSLPYGVFNNPFRIDNNPSCTVGWYNGKLYFTDWSIESKPKKWGIVGVAGLRYGITSLTESSFLSEDKFTLIIETMLTELRNAKITPKIQNP